jgi:1-acyl-sn-glycerol-3-phosphate acyltransferase
MQPAVGFRPLSERSRGARLWFRLSHGLVGVFFRLIARLRVEGGEHIPSQGGVVLASNHISMLDTLVIPYSVLAQQGMQIVWAPAKMELFRVPIVGRILLSWGAFPVRRGRGDVRAMRRMISHMQQEKVMLFPEGTRSRDGRLRRGQRMVGKLLHAARPLVIPVAVWGTDRIWARREHAIWRRMPIVVRYGPPLDLRRYYTLPDTKETSEAIVAEVMQAIASLLDTIRRGPADFSACGRDG